MNPVEKIERKEAKTVDRFGVLLRTVRHKRCLTQAQLASRAKVAARTIHNWETTPQLPHDAELENLLQGLEVTESERAELYACLPVSRRQRLIRGNTTRLSLPPSVLGPVPGIGDLLRVLRLRREWTQQQFASAMGVRQTTLHQWETTQTLPSEEEMERLCHLLDVAPPERTALQTRRLEPALWPQRLSLDECLAHGEALSRIRGGKGTDLELTDLYLLALKRQVRFHVAESAAALRLLAQMEVLHGWWLYMQGHATEGCAATARALNLVRGTLAPETFWINALNLLGSHAALSRQGPGNGVRFLSPWLHLIPTRFHPYLLCDMALYAARAQRHQDARDLLQKAQPASRSQAVECVDEPEYFDWCFRMANARVRLSAGKPVEALSWLPEGDLIGDSRILALLIWAETSLAAGERDAASRLLSEAQNALIEMPLPRHQSKLDRLAQQL